MVQPTSWRRGNEANSAHAIHPLQRRGGADRTDFAPGITSMQRTVRPCYGSFSTGPASENDSHFLERHASAGGLIRPQAVFIRAAARTSISVVLNWPALLKQ